MYDEEIDVRDAEEVDSGSSSESSSIDNDSSRDLRTPSAKQRKLLVSDFRVSGRCFSTTPTPTRLRTPSVAKRVRFFATAFFFPLDRLRKKKELLLSSPVLSYFFLIFLFYSRFAITPPDFNRIRRFLHFFSTEILPYCAVRKSGTLGIGNRPREKLLYLYWLTRRWRVSRRRICSYRIDKSWILGAVFA